MSLVVIKDLMYKVDAQQILKSIDLSIEENDWLTITGPSGSGKSTLMKLISSLLTPTSGEIIYQGKDQSEYEMTDYRKEVSYCFQNPTLFGETVYDNLLFPFTIRNLPYNDKKVKEALQMVALPESFIDKPVTELSGGERQRIALLRNLLFLPKILLLDEVTVGLDSKNKQIIHDLLEKIHQRGVTLIQISHDIEEITNAMRVVTIQEGVILA